MVKRKRQKMNNKHMLFMVLACAIPMLIVFLAPVIGIKSNYTIIIGMMVCMAAHVFMMSSHCNESDKSKSSEKKEHH